MLAVPRRASRSRPRPAAPTRPPRRSASPTRAAARSTTRRPTTALAGGQPRERRAPGALSVAADASGLAAGTYTGTVTVTAAGATGSPKTIPVTLNVNPATPVLAVSPASLAFTATAGGTNPAAQTVERHEQRRRIAELHRVRRPGLARRVAGERKRAGALSASVNGAGLAAGTYTGTITVTAAGATGSPKTVAVTLTVNPAARAPWAPGASTRAGTARHRRVRPRQQRDDHRRDTDDRGRFGSALTFDGVNDLVTVPDSASLDLTNRATLEAWVYPSALGNAGGPRCSRSSRASSSTRCTQQRPQPPERPPVHHRRPLHERHGGARAQHVDPRRHDLGRHDAAALRQRHTGRHPRRGRHAAEQLRGRCASAATTSGASGSRAASTRSASTTARSPRPRSRPT